MQTKTTIKQSVFIELDPKSLRFDRSQISDSFFGPLRYHADNMIEEIERRCKHFKYFKKMNDTKYITLAIFGFLFLVVGGIFVAGIIMNINMDYVWGGSISFFVLALILGIIFCIYRALMDRRLELYSLYIEEIVNRYNLENFNHKLINVIYHERLERTQIAHKSLPNISDQNEGKVRGTNILHRYYKFCIEFNKVNNLSNPYSLAIDNRQIY